MTGKSCFAFEYGTVFLIAGKGRGREGKNGRDYPYLMSFFIDFSEDGTAVDFKNPCHLLNGTVVSDGTI